MTAEQEQLHLLLGGYVLGGLSDVDHRAFTGHLRTCTPCQQELGQVSGLPRLLSLVDSPTTEVPYAAEPAPDAPDAGRGAGSGNAGLPDLLAGVRRRRQRRRGWLAAAATVAATAVFGAGAWLGPSLLDPPPPSEHYTATGAAGSSASVGVDLVTRGWGTQLNLACSNMPVGEEIVVYVVDAAGRESPAGSWLGTKSGYASVTGATALRPEQIRSIEVRTADGTVIAAVRT
jgi:hypothetical protein